MRACKCAPLRFDEEENEKDDDDDDDGSAFVRIYTCGPASLIPKRIRPRGIIYTGGAARRGRDDSDGDGGGNGGGAAGDGDGGEAAPLPRLLPVTTRELPYLNTMYYIVRVISYISPLNKHRLNI